MKDYVIFADSACDIEKDILDEWGVPSLPLTFRFEGEDKEYSNNDMPIAEFYNRMREGGVAKTAAVNSEAFKTGFENIIKEGKDILYLGFSSGLSTTVNSARIAASELSESYPEARIVIVDTLAASAGIGVLIRMALDKKAEGADIDECAEYIRSRILNLCHWFTVDDLVYLKRGGRISAATAFFGNAMGIKPVMHVDNDGHLINITKVRGRKTSIAALADKYTELAENVNEGYIYISHGDCIEDATLLKNMIEEKHGAKVQIITNVGTVIGAHSGPGTIALFFMGKER
ncbi:MAG: DegV family protein [Clostridia bacterium]|nr:DegV family protein [Clostridia bacterium]